MHRTQEILQPTSSAHGSESACPGLGTTYDGEDPDFLERALPLVDYIEVTPDSIATAGAGGIQLHGSTLAELKRIGEATPILVHGVGLSIGTASGCSAAYIDLLDALFAEVNVAWHSEHLAYTTVDGKFLGTMLALPRTDEALDMMCDRVERLQQRYPIPFLLENVVHLLPDAPGDYTDAAFLNAITARTGCGLILDIYNLECDAHNYGFDADAFLDELDLTAVRELHITGGVRQDGFMLDVHSRITADTTLALARSILARPGLNAKALIYELLPEAIPILGHEAIVGELMRLRSLLLTP